MTDVDARARELSDTPEHRRLDSFIRSYIHIGKCFDAMDGAANKFQKSDEWQEKYKALERYLARYSGYYWQCVDRCCEIEYEAEGQALRELWQTDGYRAQIAEETRRENAREALLPEIRDYQNGHVTYFNMAGDVIGERI